MKVAILDLDGTLIDSNGAHAKAYVEAMAEHGHDVPVDRVRPLIGLGRDKLLPEVIGVQSHSEEGRSILERKGRIFRERYVSQIQPTRGSRQLLAHMHARGLMVVLATSAREEDLVLLLDAARLKDLIDERSNPPDIEESQPDHDIVQAALDKSGYSADEALMVGDTPYDIEAAHRLGMRIIALRCGGAKYSDLIEAEAIYDDPADLLEHFDQTPLADGVVD